MAFKHFGGKAPEPLTEWTCPSCQAVNTVPLKAGCQGCGAGADARRVGEATHTLPVSKLPAPGSFEITVPASVLAFEAWVEERTTNETNWEVVREAFMAGVAWAHAQKYTEMTALPLGNPVVFTEDADPAKPYTVYLDDGKHSDPVDDPTLATILAALAFYRDNVLSYGAVPGQLDADGVNALLTRLQPQEQQA